MKHHKYETRDVFIVTREFEPDTKRHLKEDFGMLEDEAGEFLYGGGPAGGYEEKLTVRREILNPTTKQWETLCEHTD